MGIRITEVSGFEAWWPAAEQRLRDVLGRTRTLTREDVDDVVQRTAERALREEFRDEKHLTGWAVVVGRRIVVDDWRRARLERALDLRAPANMTDGVADEVVARIKRDGLVDAIDQLSAFERDTLAGNAQGGTRRAQVRANVERHRIRKRLRALYETLGIALGTWRVRGSLWFGPIAEHAGAVGAVGAVAVAAALAGGAAADVGPTDYPSVKTDVPAVAAPAPADAAASIRQSLADVVARVAAAPPRIGIDPADYWKYEPEPEYSIPLGPDYHGQPRRIGVGPGGPKDEGVLYCSGYYVDPNRKCIYYPEAVQRVMGRLDDVGLGADDIFHLVLPPK